MDNPTDTQPEPAAGAPQVILQGTAHLLGSIPHLLGYQPGRSVVLIASLPDRGGCSAPGTYRLGVVLTLRFDVPALDDVAAVIDGLHTPLVEAAGGEAGPLLLHTFVYGADAPVAAEIAVRLTRLADRHDRRLYDLVLVRNGSYLPLVAAGQHLGEDPEAEDPADSWLPVPRAADVPGVADLVLRGRFPAASRDDVAARVRRRDERAASATALAGTLLEMAPETYDPLEALERLGRWVVHGVDDPTPRDRARIVVALADRGLRDAVLARWLPRLFRLEEVLPADLVDDLRRAVPSWPPEEAGALDRLLGLAARVPAFDAVPLLTVAGAVGWAKGEGTVANEAIDLALETDPTYRMAALLRQALDQGRAPRLRHRADVA